MSGPEMYGIYPGDPGYDTFDTDFPEGTGVVKDYDEADRAMGHPVGSEEHNLFEDDEIIS